jgi:hypothetical protein
MGPPAFILLIFLISKQASWVHNLAKKLELDYAMSG